TLSLGVLTRDATYGYAYERNIGDNTIIQEMSGLNKKSIQFAAAGGLGTTVRTLHDYAGQFVASTSSKATRVTKEQENAQELYDGLAEQISTISGVNLDEELANTIIFQNAYSATARVISVTNDL